MTSTKSILEILATLPKEDSVSTAFVDSSNRQPVWPDSDSDSDSDSDLDSDSDTLCRNSYQDTFYEPSRDLYGYTIANKPEYGHKIKLVSDDEQEYLKSIINAYTDCYIYDPQTQTLYFNRAKEVEAVPINDVNKFTDCLNRLMYKAGLNYSVRHLPVEEFEELITANTDHKPSGNTDCHLTF